MRKHGNIVSETGAVTAWLALYNTQMVSLPVIMWLFGNLGRGIEKMNVEELIEKIRATGALSDDEIKDILEDAYILALVLEPFEFDVDYKTRISAHYTTNLK